MNCDSNANYWGFNINSDNGFLASQPHCSLSQSQSCIFIITLIINLGYFSWKYSGESSREDPREFNHGCLAPSRIPRNFFRAILSDGLGCSVRLTPSSCLHDNLVKPFPIARPQSAPEMSGLINYNPFAADVCLITWIFYTFFALRLSFRYGMFQLNRLSTARMLLQSFLAPWSFCKIWYPSTPQVEYAERVAVSDPTKCYYRSDGLIFMNIV